MDLIKKQKQEDLLKLIDNFNNSYCVGLNIVLDFVNRALGERTNLIFADLVQKLKVLILRNFIKFYIFKN